VTAEFTLQAGATATFVLGGVRPQGQQPEMELVGQRFQETARFWRSWIAKSKYKGQWREMVQRSALMFEVAHQLEAWIPNCGPDILAAGKHRWSA
jgi:GH15 family glucan-1,4-alpha-glucosidase